MTVYMAFICITIYLFIIYIIIFVNVWVVERSFILVSAFRPDIAPGIVRAISISIVILVTIMIIVITIMIIVSVMSVFIIFMAMSLCIIILEVGYRRS